MTEAVEWLERGDSVPTRGLTKHDLSRATGYPLKVVDRLVREGLPARPGASKRDGLRFPSLPEAIEWIAERRAAERAGPEDQSTAGAKRRLALAKAQAAELANAEKIGTLMPREDMDEWIAAAYGDTRDRLLSLSSEIPNLTEEQRHVVDDTVNGLLEEISSEAWEGAVRLRALHERGEREAAEEEAAQELDFG